MNSNMLSIDSPEFLNKTTKPGWLDYAARRIVLSKLAGLEAGEVTIVEKDRRQTFGRADDGCPLSRTWQLNRRRGGVHPGLLGML